ncbi:MAG: molybdenum cofactor guanylyltransferase [Candidatus Bathyarchaeota archaeon]|nr:molybdenum cofactor guanylyltransferase [Candidatus Bathyarchaeota archaeon]
MRSAVILAGGNSKRMTVDKGLTLLHGEPLILHTKRRVASIVDEVIVVTHTCEQQQTYQRVLDDTKIILDIIGEGSPVLGAYTGLSNAQGNYTFMTGHDMPYIDPRVVEHLFNLADGHDAATPVWPNGYVEPLHAVYNTSAGAEQARRLLDTGEMRLRMILRGFSDIVTLPVEEIRRIDPELLTLHDIDSPEDLEKAERRHQGS